MISFRTILGLAGGMILPLHALYNGNPSFPMMPEEGFLFKNSWFSWKVGYQWDEVWNRRIALKSRKVSFDRKVQTYTMMNHLGVVTWGFCDRVELYGAVGQSHARARYAPYSWTMDAHLAWDVGGRAMLAYWGDFQLGVDAKYFQTHDADAHYREWQIGLACSYRKSWWIPYLGIDYSDMRIKREDWVFKNRFPIGLLMGFGVGLARGVNVNAELRLVSEMALTLSGDIRF